MFKSKDDAAYFIPYQVRITPKIDEILADLGILSKDDWKSFIERPTPPHIAWGAGHLHFSGAHGVIVSIDSERQELVHWMDLRRYTRGIFIALDLDCVEFTERILRWSPTFVLEREANREYAIKIRVDADWWKENRGRALNGVVTKEECSGYTKTDLTIQTLPHAMLTPFRNGWDETLWKDAAEAAERFGWVHQGIGNGSFESKYNFFGVAPVFSGR